MLMMDTSALLKRYVDEPGRDLTLAAMEREPTWCVSSLAITEARIALCRLIEAKALEEVLARLEDDSRQMALVPVDDRCLQRAAEIGCSSSLRALDAIHLAAADRLPKPLRFLTFDARQRSAAVALGLEAIPES